MLKEGREERKGREDGRRGDRGKRLKTKVIISSSHKTSSIPSFCHVRFCTGCFLYLGSSSPQAFHVPLVIQVLAQKSPPQKDFPVGPVSKTLDSQCRGHRFDPSVRELGSCRPHSVANNNNKKIFLKVTSLERPPLVTQCHHPFEPLSYYLKSVASRALTI